MYVLHYLNFLNHSCPSDHLVVSLISDQGYFTFLYGLTKRNIQSQEDGRKENNHRLGLAQSTQREKFVTLLCSSLCICRLLWACIRAKFPQSHQECWLIFSHWPTRRLGPHRHFLNIILETHLLLVPCFIFSHTHTHTHTHGWVGVYKRTHTYIYSLIHIF